MYLQNEDEIDDGQNIAGFDPEYLVKAIKKARLGSDYDSEKESNEVQKPNLGI